MAHLGMLVTRSNKNGVLMTIRLRTQEYNTRFISDSEIILASKILQALTQSFWNPV